MKLRLTAVFTTATIGLVLVALAHVGQGTAAVSLGDIFTWITSGGDQTAAVVLESRLPRLLAGVVTGAAFAVAGVCLQTVARNILASPDTLAVNAAAHCTLVGFAAFGLTLPLLGRGAVAFLGGLAGAAITMLVAGGAGNTMRLILAGSALTVAFSSGAYLLMLLFSMQTEGLYAWGLGALGQNGLTAVTTYAPIIGIGCVVLLLSARKLDLLALGDDVASVRGVSIVRTKAIAVVAAIAVTAAAVTITGPIGFVGLCAPAMARLLTSVVPGLYRHLALFPLAGILGATLVLGSDVLLRALFGATAGVEVPVGVVTSVVGAIFLIVLARTLKETASSNDVIGISAPRLPYWAMVATSIGLLAAVAVSAVLMGDVMVLTGDLWNWIRGESGRVVTHVLDARIPRVLAALLAGAALAVAGAIVQAVTRNSLAEPGILGVSGGAGLAAILVITAVPLAGYWTITAAAIAGAALAGLVVFALAAKGGFPQGRVILVGMGMWAGTLALISMLITLTDPWNQTKALTWLSGSTYGRDFVHLVPITIAVLVAVPAMAAFRRDIDLLAIDETTPHILGIPVTGTRFALLGVAIVLTAASVSAAGVIAFVGLIAPHIARRLVGTRHRQLFPIAAIVGAALTCLADMLGRTLIAPAQIPVGLTVAIVGTPLFVYLLSRNNSVRPA